MQKVETLLFGVGLLRLVVMYQLFEMEHAVQYKQQYKAELLQVQHVKLNKYYGLFSILTQHMMYLNNSFDNPRYTVSSPYYLER